MAQPDDRYYVQESLENIPQSGTIYQDVVFTAGVYLRPFKALHVNTAGSVRIRGFNGQEVTFTNLVEGLWPYAGTALIESGTTADLIAIR